ncbi:DnaJ (Hsp40), sub C, member 8 [Ciborinia camelliae]|nr:DnaJ (Hsp40), sub C, member 8 [Ciborinia camelliae]
MAGANTFKSSDQPKYFYLDYFYDLPDFIRRIDRAVSCGETYIPHYLNLRVPPSASYEQIAHSYRKLVLVVHPDKVQDKKQLQNATRAYDLLLQGWAVLGDDIERLRYSMDLLYWENYTRDGCDKWIWGKEKNKGDWACLENALYDAEWIYSQEQMRRNKIIEEAEADPNRHEDVMEGVWREIRKPWFSKYKTLEETRAGQFFCDMTWVNLAHFLIDNSMPNKLSDYVWDIAERIRDRKEKSEMKKKTLEFWDGCKVYSLDVMMKDDLPKLPWSTLRSDTRLETLGEQVICADIWLVVLPILLLLVWAGLKILVKACKMAWDFKRRTDLVVKDRVQTTVLKAERAGEGESESGSGSESESGSGSGSGSEIENGSGSGSEIESVGEEW